MSEFPQGPIDLFLIEIGEPRDLVLRLVIVEAGTEGQMGTTERVTGYGSIVPKPDKQPIELVWEGYIAYSVRNECFAIPDRYQMPGGDRFAVRQKSAFLEFISAATLASDDYPGPFQHWELVCLNHVIDVVAPFPPTIRRFERQP